MKIFLFELKPKSVFFLQKCNENQKKVYNLLLLEKQFSLQFKVKIF